jgi:hypothetical protein
MALVMHLQRCFTFGRCSLTMIPTLTLTDSPVEDHRLALFLQVVALLRELEAERNRGGSLAAALKSAKAAAGVEFEELTALRERAAELTAELAAARAQQQQLGNHRAVSDAGSSVSPQSERRVHSHRMLTAEHSDATCRMRCSVLCRRLSYH